MIWFHLIMGLLGLLSGLLLGYITSITVVNRKWDHILRHKPKEIVVLSVPYGQRDVYGDVKHSTRH